MFPSNFRLVRTTVRTLILAAAALALTLHAGVFTYIYDSAGRLIQVDYGNGQAVRFTYDASGNILSQAVVGGITRFEAPLAAGGAVSRSSFGEGPVSVTYGQIVVTTPTQPGAAAIFGLTINDVLVTEAGVLAAAPVLRARMFVDFDATTNSGVAVVNPNNFPITINLELRSRDGVLVATAVISLPAGGRLAKFPNELGLNIPSPFVGTLTLSSNNTFAAVNLRTGQNANREPIFSALPLADLNENILAVRLIFAQIADGGGLPTQILLLDPSANTPAVGTISIFDDEGKPLALDFGAGVGVTSTVSYSIPANGMLKLSTTGAGPVRAGYAVVTPTSGPLPVGAVIFSVSGARGLASQAGVLRSPETTAARLFVEVSGDPLVRNTGVALVNRNATPATITLTLTFADGTTRTATITLTANAHVAKFISELFNNLPAAFQAVLSIASNAPVAAVTVRLTLNQRGDPILSVLPVVDLNNPPRGPLFLPHVVNGGGFTTQFIGVNTSGAAGNITINFFNDSGTPVLPPIR